MGGDRAAAVAKQIAAALRARGADGEPDGALAAAAAWVARQGLAARPRGAGEVAQRAGFPGVVLTAAAFRQDGGHDDVWREALADVAGNVTVNRYGVHASADGVVAVVFGRMEAALDPFPRRFQPGAACRLRGQVAARYDHARVYMTRPDGKVDETAGAGRTIDLSLPLPAAGVYQLEVMSDSTSGPVVLANVPLYVGVGEPGFGSASAPGDEKAATPAGAEARMLALLNEVRREARLAPLIADPELHAVAAAHTEEMIAKHFFGHASPTTGMVENRLEHAGVTVTLCGENVAEADSADGAHRVLMDSPAHRANMLRADFTHVGIGVGMRPGDAADLLATLVFVRRPRPPSAPVTPATAAAVISSLRRAKGAAPVAVDPVLQDAAESGFAALPDPGAAPSDRAIAAAHDALVTQAKRRNLGRRALCIEVVRVLELEELERDPILMQPALAKVGLAAATKKVGNTTQIALLVIADGATCK
ncbi:MAG TPA: CAP domain-containing protein [Polyangia bacterium]